MRKLRCKEVQGSSVADVLDQFNERAGEFGISAETDVISVSVMPPVYPEMKILDAGKLRDPKVSVVITYWSDK